MSDIPDFNYALVCRKPTADMLLAAVRAAGVNVDEAWRVFGAMVKVGEQELAGLDAQADAAGEA